MKNKIRLTFQFIILGLIGYVALRPVFDSAYVSDFEAYCPLGGISSLGSMLNIGTMSCNMSETQVTLGVALLVGVVLFGKLFCGFLCPVGTVSEWIGRLGDKLKIKKHELKEYIDRPMRLLKYALLFITLYFTMTSSELFCKEFDPYFASVNLFNNTDIVLYFAIPAFLLAVVAPLFIRMFWCKYLCPLGALTNIFLNVAIAGGLIIIYVVAVLLGAEISILWLMGALVVGGALNEIIFKKSFLTPIPKITVNTDKCSSCGFCDKKCPQGIEISKYEKVNHIDCTFCTDCVYSCPLKQTLTVSKKSSLRYLAPVAVVVLIVAGLGFSSNLVFTTIAERWGGYDKLNGIETYSQTGLKNIKCFGSSMALKSTLENVDGIVGLDTYAKSHAVTVYYDPSVISKNKVKSSLFTPVKMEVRKMKDDKLEKLAVWEAGIYGLFDLYDFNNLFYTLRENEGVYGFETHYGEPVTTSIYYNPAKTNPSKIKAQIEKKEITVKKPTGTEKVELSFQVDGTGKNMGFVNIPDYTKLIFRPYDRMFNDYKEYDKTKLKALVFHMPEAGLAPLRRYLGSLSSHLSADEGIVRLSTRYLDKPSGIVCYDPSKTNESKIKAALIKPTLTIFTSETQTKDMENPFHIKADGLVKNLSELNLDEE
ncbi:MAG TPA: 4Fe-4S binding protein [Ignavibacteriaceae bacterium]|nr:4Fe-4S binding protein [Ignavibacteriaceae bacterium]